MSKVLTGTARHNYIVPPRVLAQAKKDYEDEMNYQVSNRLTFEEVDSYKDQFRYYAAGKNVDLSRCAQEHLAGYALYVGAVPADLKVRKIAEENLAYWKLEWGLEVPLDGPLLSNCELIVRRDEAGNTIDGWLDMTARDPGRPALTGRHQLSVKALCRAIDALLPYCAPPINGRKDSSRVSAAARFLHQYIVTFVPEAEAKDINYVLYSRFGKNQ